MKKYLEIVAEMNEARARMTDTARTEKELDRLAMREAHKSGNADEYEAAKSAYKAAETRYIEECTKNEQIKIELEIMRDNAAQALLNETIGTICEIWNKYEKKPHGEKTAEKIRAEIKAATGYRVYIGNKWEDARITLYIDRESRAPFYDIEFYPKWNGSEKQPATDNNNKIVRMIPENFRVYCCGDYVENVTEHAEKIREAHKAAKDAEKALENAISEYNALTRGKINRASTREGVKNWLI